MHIQGYGMCKESVMSVVQIMMNQDLLYYHDIT